MTDSHREDRADQDLSSEPTPARLDQSAAELKEWMNKTIDERVQAALLPYKAVPPNQLWLLDALTEIREAIYELTRVSRGQHPR